MIANWDSFLCSAKEGSLFFHQRKILYVSQYLNLRLNIENFSFVTLKKYVEENNIILNKKQYTEESCTLILKKNYFASILKVNPLKEERKIEPCLRNLSHCNAEEIFNCNCEEKFNCNERKQYWRKQDGTKNNKLKNLLMNF